MYPVRRCYSSASSKRWLGRSKDDTFSRQRKVQGLKSRAAFKLLEIDAKHRLFRKGQIIIDLGYAPGSWSQVAKNKTGPTGLVVGIDIIPALPPKGVSTIQGNFLSPNVQAELQNLLSQQILSRYTEAPQGYPAGPASSMALTDDRLHARSLVDRLAQEAVPALTLPGPSTHVQMVDVILSDMSEPWAQTDGFWKRSLSNPYYRMSNTSGNTFRDHAQSMDLCNAALAFSLRTLRPSGSFLCKIFQGSEDKAFESAVRCHFHKVTRIKPESSRQASKEAYILAQAKR